MGKSGLRALAVAVFALWIGGIAQGQQMSIKLFKVITAKDEVEIGLPEEQLRSFGPAGDVENLANRLVSAGQITVWQYAVRRAADGSLEHAPLKQVAIFKADTLRIEPFNPAPLKIAAPQEGAEPGSLRSDVQRNIRPSGGRPISIWPTVSKCIGRPWPCWVPAWMSRMRRSSGLLSKIAEAPAAW